MCLVLDTNVFGAFFDPESEKHNEFIPALEWVVRGKGKIVFGGSKYKNEMKETNKYIRFFASLERAGKLVRISDSEVDRKQDEVKKMEPKKDFDDPHLVAIVLVSQCRIICTNDKRALPYLKRTDFYKGKVKKPKVYQSKRNSSLLADCNIADICLPCKKLNKKQSRELGLL